MNNPDYHIEIETKATPAQAFTAICDVPEWWGQDFTGSAKQTGDQFTIRFGTTFVDFLIGETTPGQKMVWNVTASHLPWLKDTAEWTDHEITFQIDEIPGGSRIGFTQKGLTPVVECFESCEKGWNFYIGESLKALLNTGTGRPD